MLYVFLCIFNVVSPTPYSRKHVCNFLLLMQSSGNVHLSISSHYDSIVIRDFVTVVFNWQNTSASFGDFSLYDSVEVWTKIQAVVSPVICYIMYSCDVLYYILTVEFTINGTFHAINMLSKPHIENIPIPCFYKCLHSFIKTKSQLTNCKWIHMISTVIIV